MSMWPRVERTGAPPGDRRGRKGQGRAGLDLRGSLKDRKDRFARQYWVAAGACILLKEDLRLPVRWQEPPAAAAPATTMATASATKGKVTGNIFGYKKSPLDPPDKDQPLQDYVAESVNGTQIITDPSGQYGPVPGPLNTSLIGPFVRVINDGSGRALSSQARRQQPAVRRRHRIGVAQVSAFDWVNFAHEFVKPFLPGTLSKLANNEVHVNINETCNAFWNGADNSLNFFKSGDSSDGRHCVNSAYCDVACHEFGHGVDAEFGEILDAAYSEGFGDSLAILITWDSVVGRDFLGQGMNLRNAADRIQWPEVKDDFDPHVAGQPYACFTWDLIVQLKAKFNGDEKKAYDTVKELTLGAAALNPRDVPDAVRLVFFVTIRTVRSSSTRWPSRRTRTESPVRRPRKT